MKKLQKISKTYYLRQIAACFLVHCMLFVIPVQVAPATPTNPNVVAGSAGIGQSGNTTTVNMGSARAVINWDSLNTNSNEILQFLKASGNFAVLNRVIKGGATQFNGSLFGNQGHIIIVNPHGIVFGPTALIRAYEFTASALDIANTDFINGIYNFTGDGIGKVANYGHISAEQVALIGKKVLNAGVIRSPGGYVLLVAGDSVFLGAEGSDVVVEIADVTVPQGPLVEGMGDVINEGTVEAAGGKIVLAAGDTFSRAIEGLDSLTVAVDGGIGRVGQFGTLDVDDAEGDGGSITLTAGEVVDIGKDSLTTANAGTDGDGGYVVAYSPETVILRDGAQIEAKGGSWSGDGGFVEISGKKHVEVFGSVNTSANNGKSGTFLIDPTDITIQDTAGSMDPGSGGLFTPSGDTSSVSDDAIEDFLNNGTSVQITTTSSGNGGGDITQNSDAQINKTVDNGDVALTLTADRHIDLYGGIVSEPGAGVLNVILNADDHITTNAEIDLNGGSFDAQAGVVGIGNFSDLNVNANITAGSITLKAGSDSSNAGTKYNITVADGVSLQSTSGDLTVWAREHITLGGSAMADNGSISVTADGDNAGRGNLSTKELQAQNGNIELVGRNVTVDGSANAGGDLTIRAMADWGFDGGGTVYAKESLQAGANGNIDISVRESMTDDTIDSSGQIILDGDAIAGVDTTLHNNTIMSAIDTSGGGGPYPVDQLVQATTGTLTTYGYLQKKTPGDLTVRGGSADTAIDLHWAGPENGVSTCLGNLILEGNGDIQIGVDLLTTFGPCVECWYEGPPVESSFSGGCNGPYDCRPTGGVSVVSANGKVYTEGATPENDTLDVTIMGNSDHRAGLGVDLPHDESKAAIIVMSAEDLKFGPDTILRAYGRYYDNGGFELHTFGKYLGTVLSAEEWTAFKNALAETGLSYRDEGFEDFVKDYFADYLDIYFAEFGVDDRPAILFLAEDASIGGFDRDQGDAMDVAIYAGSTQGDVELNTENVSVGGCGGDGYTIQDQLEGGWGVGTVVLDAFDSVRLPIFEGITNFTDWFLMVTGYGSIGDFLADQGHATIQDFLDDAGFEGTFDEFVIDEFGLGEMGFRLEVCSRITEWLQEAIDNERLPFAENPEFFEAFLGNDYVLRGAGLGNPVIDDGRAWVLEDEPPIEQVAAPLAELQIPQIEGCPVLMEAVAVELGTTAETLQISMGTSLALNPSIQPCEACARLVNAAAILSDEGGSRMAAMNRVFNELAPAEAPFTPEMAASIATVLETTVEGTHYATAVEYIDAFVEYVAVLDTELGSPVADSVAFVMEKYGTGITENENTNIAAFVATRLEMLETFGG